VEIPALVGKTPVKGTDYWTEADREAIKEEMVADHAAEIEAAAGNAMEAIEAKGTETLASIPEDYATLDAEVDQIRADMPFSAAYEAYSGYYYHKYAGAVLESASYCGKCTAILPCTPGEVYAYKGHAASGAASVLFYVDGVCKTGAGLQYSSLDGYVEVTVPSGVNGVRFCSQKVNTPDVAFDVRKITAEPLVGLSGRVVDIENRVAALEGADGDHYRSALTGKKWVVCGDSFSAPGAAVETLASGMYAGMGAVYAYYIGNRTHANIEMLAASGQTMTSIASRNGNCFSEKYTSIPADADYITLWHGINDRIQGATLGTVDDTDITTFYGAWNTVMSYIKTNHPFAHVGIVISCGRTADMAKYCEAERVIARKYGVPYLDLQADDRIPLMMGCIEREGLSEDVLEATLEVQRISADDGHPNARAHEFQSYFIENWLHSL